MRCLLDLDGVLVDFVNGACRAHGRENPFYRYGSAGEWEMATLWGISQDDFWLPLRSEEFWAGLFWTEDGSEILALVEQSFGTENVCLLSNPSGHPGAAAGKIRWIGKYLPQYLDKRFLIGPAKEFCAGTNSVLIDDRAENIDDFERAGGGGILVPRAWNRQHKVAWDALRCVEQQIKAILND